MSKDLEAFQRQQAKCAIQQMAKESDAANKKRHTEWLKKHKNTIAYKAYMKDRERTKLERELKAATSPDAKDAIFARAWELRLRYGLIDEHKADPKVINPWLIDASFCGRARAYLRDAGEYVQTTEPNTLDRRGAMEKLWTLRDEMRNARATLPQGSRAASEIVAVVDGITKLHDMAVDTENGGGEQWWNQWHKLNAAVDDAEPMMSAAPPMRPSATPDVLAEKDYHGVKKKAKLNTTDEKAANYIRDNPGCKGEVLALSIGVTSEHFRSRIFPKLRENGFYNDDGYHAPKRKETKM